VDRAVLEQVATLFLGLVGCSPDWRKIGAWEIVATESGEQRMGRLSSVLGSKKRIHLRRWVRFVLGWDGLVTSNGRWQIANEKMKTSKNASRQVVQAVIPPGLTTNGQKQRG
jgi:hypothetical protein